jgi:CRISPR-associated endonuclease Cas2
MSKIRRQVLASKSMKNAKKFTEIFLEAIYFAMDAAGSLNCGRYSIYSSLRKGAFSDWSDTKISKKLCEMERVGYIRHDHQSDSIEFTDKAKIRIIDTLSLNHEVDGMYRFLSFDIPEHKRSLRDGFRRAIKRLGFKQVQKSLWVCNKNVGDLVEVIIDEYKIDDYVTYIISEKSDIDDYIKKMFEDENNKNH